MKAAKQTGLLFGGATAFIFIIYLSLWVLMANNIKGQAKDFMADARKKDIHFVVRSMEVKNFPFTPEIRFSGRIYNSAGTTLEVPQLKIRSLFMTGKPLTINAPEGISLLEPVDTDIWSLDNLHIETIIPAYLPETATNEDLAYWRDNGGEIILDRIVMEKDTLYLIGSGRAGVDKTLQPAGEFSARITGHMDFMKWLQEKGYVETKEALLSAAVLSSLSKQDPETNETYMEVTLTIQNQTLFLGPLRLAYLPSIQWGWRSAPGPIE